MKKDIRDTALYQHTETLFRTLRQPGTGKISDAAEVHVSPCGNRAVFAGTIVDKLEGIPPTRICSVDLKTGDTTVLTSGPNVDRLPKYSPDGQQIAFLSDRHKVGDFQLYLLNPATGAMQATAPVEGWVEYLHWSPDGKKILLGVAGHGADIAGGQGAVTSKQQDNGDSSAWMPAVETGDESFRWRRAWVYDLANNTAKQISDAETNIWETVWCGNDHIAAVVSPGPSEGLWYTATLQTLSLNGDNKQPVYQPEAQLGWPCASPSGNHLVVVESLCSDRWLVAGDLLLNDTASGKVTPIDTRDISISYTEWRTDKLLLLAGHRDFETVVCTYNVVTDQLTELWSSETITSGGRFVSLAGIGDAGDCVIVGETFTRAPEIATIYQGDYQTVTSFDLGYAKSATVISAVKNLTWAAPDGLDIQGYLLVPKGEAPHPLVLYVHGGPVWQWRPSWLGRSGQTLAMLMLVQQGYAVFLPNPRGSGGRGQDFTRPVYGDAGGDETYDHISGLDYLIEQGLADPKRIGVTGASHGGYMSSWIITQDTRFAAAVPVAPVTDWVSQHLVSNIPYFDAMILNARFTEAGNHYFERSPIMQAHKVTAPTLTICGALDRCTPPGQAMEFHNALLENNVESVLVTYPEEGHGVKQIPATVDFVTRVAAWFKQHMPSTNLRDEKGLS